MITLGSGTTVATKSTPVGLVGGPSFRLKQRISITFYPV